MKKTITLVSLSLVTGLVLLDATGNKVISNTSGSPAAHTGSPADGMNCTMCHGGSASASSTQLITSNIPASGYVPGQTYTITAAVGQQGISKYGFQISPQSPTGTLLGSLAITNSSATKIVGTKYVTHTAGGTSAPSFARTWSFNWTAPAAGTGNVTFYGAFNYSNSQGNSSGDLIRLNTLTVNEGTGVGIAENIVDGQFSAFPNPVIDRLQLKADLTDASEIRAQLFDLTGKATDVSGSFAGVPGPAVFNLDIPASLPAGIYQLLIETTAGKTVKKIYKQ